MQGRAGGFARPRCGRHFFKIPPRQDHSFAAFGGGARAHGKEASFNVSGLFAPTASTDVGGAWAAALPLESPIVARTHNALQGADLKTPGFMVGRSQPRRGVLDDSVDVPAYGGGAAAPVALTVPKTPKFATSARLGASKAESTEERELRLIEEQKERQRVEREKKEQRMRRALTGAAQQAASVAAAPLPLTQPRSPKFATDSRAAFAAQQQKLLQRSFDRSFDANVDEAAVHEEEAVEEPLDTRNKMFFTVGASNKPVAERKFVLQSDRRAAAKLASKKAEPPREEYVGLAERLHRVQQAHVAVDDEDEVEGNTDADSDQPARRVMEFAPFKPTIAKTPNFATKHRSRAPSAWRQQEHVVVVPKLNAGPVRVPVAPAVRPEVTLGRTPHFATKARARRQPVSDKKKYRTGAAKHAAADGGAVGVPMIAKAALTRFEEFDFATAARALAIEEGLEAAGQPKSLKKTARKPRKPDVFEAAAMEVATTANKIGMYVDLDGDLDQDVAVAKLATTGRKRQQGRSRFFDQDNDGDDGAALAQPDFGLADKPTKQPQPERKRERAPAQQQQQPQLTVPKTPKFATSARARAPFQPKRDPSPNRRPAQKPRAAEPPRQQQQQQPAQLTIPKTPKFATSSRARPVVAPAPVEPISKKPTRVPVQQHQQQQQQVHHHVAPAAPELTEPKPFSFATDARMGHKEAKPAPQSNKPLFEADKYSTARTLTEPKPFSFATSARLGAPLVRATENAHPNQVASRAQPVDHAMGGLTNPEPFHLRVSVRGAVAQEVLAQKLREEEEELRRRAQFRAKPFVECAPPAPAPRATLPLTHAEDVVLNSDVRAARRHEFEAADRLRREQQQRADEARERERAQREQQELKELRKRLVHKPMPVYREHVAPAPRAAIPLTVPQSPAFATSKRFTRIV